MVRSCSARVLQKSAQPQSYPAMELWPGAAYLHIPFCQQRCHYCDFATGLGTPNLIETYVQMLCLEIGQTPLGEQPLETIFFGGGTPSLLTTAQVQRILDTLQDRVPWTPDIEISLEANPGTVTQDSLAGYAEAGVNRISLGVQAFQSELLAVCGRKHGVEEVYAAIADLREVNLENFNLDLIFGLPHQTLDHWRDSLQAVLAIRPKHVSLYDLTVESGTRFGRLYRPGDQPLPTDMETVAMYRMAIDELTAAGYEHYEISNFAQPGYACRHNRIYWENRSYYGFGMGAVGYVRGRRLHQPQRLHDYFQQVRAGQAPQGAIETLAERWMDTVMLTLRLREGLALPSLRLEFGSAWVDRALDLLEEYRPQGWVSWDQERLRLQSPEGWLHSNTVMARLFEVPEP